jgi:hypothetical protein
MRPRLRDSILHQSVGISFWYSKKGLTPCKSNITPSQTQAKPRQMQCVCYLLSLVFGDCFECFERPF